SQVNYSFSDKEVQEQAYVDLFRGASQVALPFVLPPGVNGFSPSLYLSYSSQRVLGNGFVGYGWDLPLGFVQRLNKDGIDQMYLEPTYSISLGNLQGELTLLETIGNVQRYGLKTESDFARIDFNTTDNRWEVSLRNGVKYHLGQTDAARVQNANGSMGFAWYIQKVQDLHGNSVEYEYVRDSQMLYPKVIYYGGTNGVTGTNHPFQVRFLPFYNGVGSLPNRTDLSFDYHSGFRIDTKGLLEDVEIWIQGQKKLTYELEYINDHRSDLKRVRVVPADGVTTAQVIELGYFSKIDGYTNTLAHRNNLLRSVQWPQGGKVGFEYKNSSQFFAGANYNQRPHFPLVLVQSVTKSDFTGRNDVTNYFYESASYYSPNMLDRQMAGFGKVTVTDPLNQKSVYFFHQGGGFDGATLGEAEPDHRSFIGKLYRSEQYDSSAVLRQKRIMNWTKMTLSGTDRFFPMLESTVTFVVNGSTTVSTAAKNTYDTANGNVLEQIEYGLVSAQDDGTFTDSGTDSRKKIFTYATNSGLYLSAFVASEELFDHSNASVSKVSYLYDGLSAGQVTVGDRTQVMHRFAEESRDITTAYQYDTAWNVTQLTDPLSNVMTYTYDSLKLHPLTST